MARFTTLDMLSGISSQPEATACDANETPSACTREGCFCDVITEDGLTIRDELNGIEEEIEMPYVMEGKEEEWWGRVLGGEA